MSTERHASEDDSTYDGPDSDIASGNITDADFAPVEAEPEAAEEVPGEEGRHTD
jgi:hypothetical protein